MIVIGDTSGLVAAFNVADRDHASARKSLLEASLTVVSPLVLLEIEHVTTRNVDRRAALAINDWLLAQERTGRIAVSSVSAHTLRRARSVQDRYAGLRLDLSDAILVVTAADFETNVILTLDRRDFRAVSPVSHDSSFRLLPDDL